MIKPGQIYKNDDVVTSIYVVTNVIYGKDRNKIYCIYEDGSCGQIPNHFLERSELLKTFSTWQEAVNSPEFKGERHD
nr:MAG TPA: hypothetical protein [Caudoviricetes sp.]DAV98667.1 MAG TPA: hypothetical protein [Caudoviricetes sp.]